MYCPCTTKYQALPSYNNPVPPVSIYTDIVPSSINRYHFIINSIFLQKTTFKLGQEQACTRITCLFLRLVVCHHAEKGLILPHSNQIHIGDILFQTISTSDRSIHCFQRLSKFWSHVYFAGTFATRPYQALPVPVFRYFPVFLKQQSI